MFKIEYNAVGTPVSDFKIDYELRYVKSYIESGEDTTLAYSTSNIFSAIRLAIVTGEIDFNKICFVFEDETILINKYGAIPHWPNGFCDISVNTSEKILRAALDMIRKDKGEDK